jgi:hypothetical protein
MGAISQAMLMYGSAAGGGGGFVPTDIASINYWLTADSLVLSDGDPVVDWLYSGTKNYGQNTVSAQPTYKTNIVNGKPVVRFTTDDKLVADPTALTLATANTIIAVCTPSSTANSYIFGGDGGGGIPAFISGFGGKSFEYFNSNSERATFAASTSGFHILTLTRTDDSGNAVGYFDGASAFSIAVDTSLDFLLRNINEIGANGNAGGEDFYNGDIRHILHYSAVLTSAELNDVHTYLGNDCGISITLI